MLLLRILVFILGVATVASTLLSEIRAFVLPRSAPDSIAHAVFVAVRWVFDLSLHWRRSYDERDRVMAWYAPIGLLMLVPVWLALILAGYAGIFWSVGEPWPDVIQISASSLMTVGFAQPSSLAGRLIGFSEAAIGLILIALLIGYLPTMYSAFSRREALVALLEVRAGNPPSAVEMIKRFYRLHGLQRLGEQWRIWEGWFVDIQESHTSLAALVYFRSPEPSHSWVTAAGAVLDAASLSRSSLDIPTDIQADLCIRAGYLALRHIADFFRVSYDPSPPPDAPIGVTRQEYDEVYDDLAAYGVPMKPDRDQAWRDFAGWRVNYDTVLRALAALTMAPYAPWSSDRQMPQANMQTLGGMRR